MKDTSIPIIAINKETGKRVGEYPSINKAARSLFIKRSDSIWSHLFGGRKTQTFKGTSSGIKSYKTGIKYLFEVKIQ